MPSPAVILFLSLLTAHLIGDFLLQTDTDVKNKRQPRYFFKHVGTLTAMAYLMAGAWTTWWIPLVVAVTHGLIDRGKLLAEDLGWKGGVPYVIDQIAHISVAVAIAFIPAEADLPSVWWFELAGMLYVQACLLVSGFVFTVHFGCYLIGMTIQPFLDEVLELDKRRAQATREGLGDSWVNADGLAQGGKIIGQLERALIFFFVMVGQPQAVAFLVAAKSVFRFGELSKSRKEAEYILIGTLMSFGWSLSAAWLTKWAGEQLGLI